MPPEDPSRLTLYHKARHSVLQSDRSRGPVARHEASLIPAVASDVGLAGPGDDGDDDPPGAGPFQRAGGGAAGGPGGQDVVDQDNRAAVEAGVPPARNTSRMDLIRSVRDNLASLSVATTRRSGRRTGRFSRRASPRRGPRPGYSPGASVAANAAGPARSRRPSGSSPIASPRASAQRSHSHGGQPGVPLVLEPQAEVPEGPLVRPHRHRRVEAQRTAPASRHSPDGSPRTGRPPVHNAGRPTPRPSPPAPARSRHDGQNAPARPLQRRRPRTTRGTPAHRPPGPRAQPARDQSATTPDRRGYRPRISVTSLVILLLAWSSVGPRSPVMR